jgi:hypothetical protein
MAICASTAEAEVAVLAVEQTQVPAMMAEEMERIIMV